MIDRQRIVILGISLGIAPRWTVDHATTYRGLVRELVRRRHQVTVLERDVPCDSDNGDRTEALFGKTVLYGSVDELRECHVDLIREADLVIVGSHLQDGIEIGHWVCSTARGVSAFYDFDTPATLAALATGTCGYLSEALIPRFDLYLSVTGGPTLDTLERHYGARRARAFYCSFDPASYHPEDGEIEWDLGYIGSYCPARQPELERLMLSAARTAPQHRFVIAGRGYPSDATWPRQVTRVDDVPANRHRQFYTSQRFTLNLTRADVARAGHSPSARLFEAAACGVPIITDYWTGVEAIFSPGIDILIAESWRDTLRYLAEVSEPARMGIGRRARRRVLGAHTAEHRAVELEQHLADARRPERPAPSPSEHLAV